MSWSILGGAIAGVAGLVSSLTGSAAAVAGQPAAAAASGPFELGPSNSPGSVALAPDGSRVAVFDVKSGRGRTRVCLIAPSGRKCWHSTLLKPPGSDFTFGTPGVFIPSPNHVVVVQHTCCDANPASTVLYTSANGGKTFSGPVRVSQLGVDASELVGRQILITQRNSASGLQVASIPVSASAPVPTATIASRVAYSTGLGQYKGGALVGTDYSKSFYTTYVYYAPKGKSFGVASSYRKVGTYPGESLLAMSGAALLTDRSKGDVVRLRMFTGTGFGPAHAVPHVHGGLLTWFTVCQDPSGRVHVFAILGSAKYHLLEVSTSDGGKTWSQAADLGNAVRSVYLSAAINSRGHGLVLGNTPAWGYPVP